MKYKFGKTIIAITLLIASADKAFAGTSDAMTICQALLSASPDDFEHVFLETYRKLLVEIGADLVSEADLRKMLETNDFFSFSDEGDSKKDHLQEALNQLRDQIPPTLQTDKTRGRMRSILIDTLDARTRESKRAGKAQRKARKVMDPLRLPNPGGELYRDLHFSPNGKMLIAGAGDHFILWKLHTKSALVRVPIQYARSAVGQVISADFSKVLTSEVPPGLLDVKTKKKIVVADIQVLIHPRFSKNGKRLYGIGSGSTSITIIDTISGKVVRTIDFGAAVRAKEFDVSSDEKYAIVTREPWGSTVKEEIELYYVSLVEDLSPKTRVLVPEGLTHSAYPHEIFITPDARQFGIRDLRGHIAVWNSADLNLKFRDYISADIPSDVFLVAPSGDYFIAKDQNDGVISLFDTQTGKKRFPLIAEGLLCATKPAISPDSTLIAAAIEPGLIRIIRSSDGSTLGQIPIGKENVAGMAISSDSHFIAVTSPSGTLILDLAEVER